MKNEFGQPYPLVREQMFARLTEKPGEQTTMTDKTALVELPADAAIRRLREDMEKIRQERDDLRRRELELDEEEEELLLSAMMEHVDPLCVRLGITLERAVALLQKEAERRIA